MSFDELSRKMGRTTSRRGILKMIGGAAGAAVAAVVLKPFRAEASCPSGRAACGDACCEAGIACVNASTSTCGCPSGQQRCGGLCCPPNGTCTDPNRQCCCAPGLTPCGQSCCAKGVACVNRAQGICGCPKGYTQCVTKAGDVTTIRCCAAGKACSATCPTVDTLGTVVSSCASCTADDDRCQSANECCSGVCQNGDCCSPNGTSCDNNSTVCCNSCINGTCQSNNN